MRVSPIAAVLALALAGCGDRDAGNQAAPPPAPANAGTGMTTVDQVAGLGEAQRNGVFMRAIRDSRLQCQQVESSAPAPGGDPRNWVARCDGGQAYTITVGEDGNIVVQRGEPVAGGR